MRSVVQFLGVFVLLLAISKSEAQLATSTARPGSPSAEGVAVDPDKAALFDWIDSNVSHMNKLGLEIWNTPELSFREFKTSRAVMQYLQDNGFDVEKNAAGMPTAFVAIYGSGKPVVAFWMEEDALIGLSQKPEPVREPITSGAPGHACGHNLIAASTAAAAVAVKGFLQRTGTKGTIRVYGTPAEEAGGGKEYMRVAGLFKDVDVLLGWHPSSDTLAQFEYTKAAAELHVHFEGVAAHASMSPDLGRNALHAVELMDSGVNFLREQLKEDARVSYVISNGGGQPNVIPAEAESWYSIRANKHEELAEIVQWVSEIANGAAMMTRTHVKVRIDNDEAEVLPNEPLARDIYENLLVAGTPNFSSDDKAYVRKMLAEVKGEPRAISPEVTPLPEAPGQQAYSTDLGNISWSIPTGRLAVGIAPYALVAHSWQFAAASASVGLKSLPVAAKTLAATAVDCFKRPALIQDAKKDLQERTNGHTYSLLTPLNRTPPVYKEGGTGQ